MEKEKKDDLPAMPFYWGDWFKSPDVQCLEPHIRCLWFEMLGRMWESNERGYLTINGKPMSSKCLARALGFSNNVEEFLDCKNQIEEAGLFSKREDGAIFSRKILNDMELRKKRQFAGSKGGKQKPSKSQANGIANCETETKGEYEDETTNKTNNKRNTRPVENLWKKNAFESIWDQYPKNRKLGKKEALGYFNATIKSREDILKIKKALINYKNYIESKDTDTIYIKNGCNWFAEWEDWFEIEPEPKKVNYESIVKSKLSNIATDDMIVNVMKEVPEGRWFIIENYLKKRYSNFKGLSHLERRLKEEKKP